MVPRTQYQELSPHTDGCQVGGDQVVDLPRDVLPLVLLRLLLALLSDDASRVCGVFGSLLLALPRWSRGS